MRAFLHSFNLLLHLHYIPVILLGSITFRASLGKSKSALSSSQSSLQNFALADVSLYWRYFSDSDGINLSTVRHGAAGAIYKRMCLAYSTRNKFDFTNCLLSCLASFTGKAAITTGRFSSLRGVFRPVHLGHPVMVQPRGRSICWEMRNDGHAVLCRNGYTAIYM